MIHADEARKLTDKRSEEVIEDELRSIEGEIRGAIAGKRYNVMLKDVSEKTRAILEEMGYRIGRGKEEEQQEELLGIDKERRGKMITVYWKKEE